MRSGPVRFSSLPHLGNEIDLPDNLPACRRRDRHGFVGGMFPRFPNGHGRGYNHGLDCST